jgi:hypothetical protein
MMRMAAADLTYDSRSVYRTVCVIFRWPKPRLPCDQWLRQGIPRQLAGMKDRPSDLGTPRTFLGGVLGSHEIVLSQWSFNGQRMLRHVGCQ